MLKLVLSLLVALSTLLTPAVKARVPYYRKGFTEPSQVAELFANVPIPGKTPAFTKNGEVFTTQEELLDFIYKLEKKSKFLTVKIIGTSQEGRDIPALYFTKEKDISPESFSKKPTVWLHAQIHGSEPAGGEAALVIAERLTGKLGKEVLDKINVIIIPRRNPDGSYAFNRTFTSGDDGNRDHTKMVGQENQVVHNEFKRYSPEVVIDAHEYGPTRVKTDRFGEKISEYYDILLLPATNPNVPKELRDYSLDVFAKPAHQEVKAQGFSSTGYYTVGTSTTGHISVTEGGPDARIGRNLYGLHLAISFLVESRGIGFGRQNFPRRVASQAVVHENLIRTAAKEATTLKDFITKQRAQAVEKGLRTNDNDLVVITSTSRKMKNISFPFINVTQGAVIEIPVSYYSWIDAIPTLTRERPIAYLLRPEYTNISDMLEIQGVQGFKLPTNWKLPVEAYNITEKGQGKMVEEEYLVSVKTELVKKWISLPKGTFVYPTAQVASNLLCYMFEPDSGDSLISVGILPAELGVEVPIYRFMMNSGKLYDEIYKRTRPLNKHIEQIDI